MTTKCENCGQPLLEGDTECWQCGRKVTSAVGGATTAQVKQKWGQASSSSEIPALAVYGGLTVFLIVLALLVTIYLGRQPLVQAASQAPSDGWAFVTNRPRDFVLMLPESWAILDEHDAEGDAFDRLVTASPRLTQATYPLGNMAEDLRVLFVAAEGIDAGQAGDDPAPAQFVVVAGSDLLNRLSNEEAQAVAERAAAADQIDLVEAMYVDDFDRSHLFLATRIPTESGELICRQQFVVGDSSSLIVAACGPDQQLSGAILESFQRLAE